MELCDVCLMVLYLGEKKENDIYIYRETDRQRKTKLTPWLINVEIKRERQNIGRQMKWKIRYTYLV